MTDTSSNNKRIAKNTLLLYVRMLFMMAISLFTSRVILNTLGVEEYGIQNVVGGVVAMFGFLNGSMSSATQRHITIALGKGVEKRSTSDAIRYGNMVCESIPVDEEYETYLDDSEYEKYLEY